MISELLLHPKTRSQYELMASQPPHAILITGITGSGKHTLSQRLAADILGIESESLVNHPYYFALDQEADTIPIEEIRSLQQFLKLKVPGAREGISRVILITQAERMRTEAQNALLKTLEEPPADTCIILTAEGTEVLLPTITSRTAQLAILPVSTEQASDYYMQKGKKPADIAKFYALSQGQAGLLFALLHDEEHPLLPQVELAKAILAEKPGQRLLRTDELAKDKPSLKLLLNALMRISHAALQSSAIKQNNSASQRWNNTLATVLETSKQLKYNASTKLLLDNLFLNI